jgi:hypothetical protein
MRQFRTSGSVRGVAREGDSYRDKFKVQRFRSSNLERGTLNIELYLRAHDGRIEAPLARVSDGSCLPSSPW